MTEHDEQLERFREAVDRKAADAKEASEATQHERRPDVPGDEGHPTEHDLVAAERPPDVFSVRDKSSGKGKKTADKWNQ
jgi:hypothetical protein